MTCQTNNLLYHLFSQSGCDWIWRATREPVPEEEVRIRECQFDSFRLLLKEKRVEKEEEEFYEDIWRDIRPLAAPPTPTPAPPTPVYEVSLREFARLSGLTLCTSLCRFFHKQRHTHTRLCRERTVEVAHSFTDLLAFFHLEETQRYYMYWMEKLVRSGASFQPPKVPFQVLSEGDDRLKCEHCGNRISLGVRLLLPEATSGFRPPTCLIVCAFCNRKTLLDIYASL